MTNVPEDCDAAKARVRAEVSRALRAMSPAERAMRSTLLVQRLAKDAAIAEALTLLGFAPIGGEPDIGAFIEARLRANLATALLRTDWETNQMDAVVVQNLSADCATTRYSILQPRADLLPLALDRLDVVLVPGVAFDAGGGRLGRGGGFYDRFLARVLSARAQCVLVGICFDEQIVDLVPTDAHDVRVGMIVTPTRTVRC
jgi:5-formyltetrahydrofolate cyclo-ligase